MSYGPPVRDKEEKILLEKNAAADVTKSVELAESLTAPVTAGQQIGMLTVSLGSSELGSFPIVAGDDVDRLTWGDIFYRMLRIMFTGGCKTVLIGYNKHGMKRRESLCSAGKISEPGGVL